MASNNLPNPQSYEQLLGDSLSSYASKVGISDFNVGSAITSFFEVVALIAARASGDVFQILKDFSVDRATGDALQRLAAENNIIPVTALPATGFVTVTDTSFTKISTQIYAGSIPPNIGSTIISVGNASIFPSSGAIYIGRGTPNVEGPLAYSTPPVQVGNYWNITLNTGTAKFHNVNETVILSRGGNRPIPINTIVISPSIGANPDIQYSVTTVGVILDGEVTVSNIPISALLPGSSGNVPIGAINSFTAPPFSGATVTNPLPLTTGANNETDDQLRVRIKNQLASIGLGTATAVKASVIGAVSLDGQSTIVSSSLLQASYGAVLYIDNGNGYEATWAGVGLESIVDSALGGESFFQLATGGKQAPVTQSFLLSAISAPFDLIGTDTLAVIVAGQTYQHVFSTSDFRSPGSATAYEVAASINLDTTLGFEAVTSGNGTYVVIRPINQGNGSIEITTPTTSGRDASILLGFPSGLRQPLFLFKNNILLSEAGNTATVFTQDQQLWSSTIASGDTIILSVDGTASITYTINNSDFIATGLYTNVSPTNSLASWIEVFNNKLTGVTAEVVGQQIAITSNLNANNRAAIVIDPSSTLVSKGMFTALIGLQSFGKTSDYTLDRNTAQIQLAVPLIAGDKLAAGSSNTEATITGGAISAGSVTFSSNAYFWLLIDTQGQVIPTGVAGNTLLSVSAPSTNTIRYTSSVVGSFSNVLPGDYVIIWSTDIPSSDRMEGRVHSVTGTTLDILITASEYAAIVPVVGAIFTQGFIVVRCVDAPQKFELTSGTLTLDQIAAALQTQTNSAIFSIFQEEYLVIRSTTQDSSGSLLVVTADTQGQLLNLPVAIIKNSESSLIAFYDTQTQQAQLPLFIHSTFSADALASPPDSFIPTIQSSISLAERDPNELISFLHPYGIIEDAQPYGDSVQETSISGTTINITQDPTLRRIRGNIDRYYIGSPLDFGNNDTAVVVVDNNPNLETFAIPLYRHALTNTSISSNPTTFDAYDVLAGPTTNFVSTFGSGFSFANYKVLMQAKKVLKPTPPQTAILYRSVLWGSSGESINIGYVYPSVPNAPISSIVTVADEVIILINLQSGAAIPTSIDGTTEWNISVTPNTPSAGIDQVTYTYNGTGTAPALTLSGGEYVNITKQTEFNINNTGIFRVSTQAGFTPTSTSFSVQMPNGQAVAQTNRATLVTGAITFYSASATTAAQVVAYVNANLNIYVTATLVNDGGTSGSGIIVLSTYEDSGFTSPTIQLLDGVNWLAASNLSGSPQFTLKNNLALPTDIGYAFNNGETIIFTPTTMQQVQSFISVLAVSGFTTAGTVNIVDRGSRLALATDILGSGGAIQIIGGLANSYQTPILDSGLRVDNNLMNVSVNRVAGAGILSDQWFRLNASLTQAKEALFSSNSSITIKNNTPSIGKATITMLNRQLNQRYFGKPRNYIRSRSRTFRIEQQGSLACLSWNGSGASPVFEKSPLNFNDSGGGTVNVYPISGGDQAQYVILTGNTNFTELSIGDLLTISGMPYAGNNGTFLVTGVSGDGTNVQVLNSNAVNQFSSGTFTLNTNSTPGDAFTVGASTLVAGTNFAIGGTAAQTATNLSAIIGTISNVTSTASGSVVTITATIPSANISLSYSGIGSVTVSGAALAGTTFVAGQFMANSEISEGDTLIVSAPFNVLNQGQFRVIRLYNNSVWFENPNVIEEEVNLPYNSINLGFDATTSFMVNATNHSIYLTWNGVGTEPHLENAEMGDVITFGTDFASANQGQFMVLRSGPKVQEIATFVIPPGSQFTQSVPGQYFFLNSAGNVNRYYVWFNINGTNTDPAPIGLTGIQVNCLSGDNSSTVALNAAAAILAANGGLDFVASATSGILTVITVGYMPTNDPTNHNMPSPFSITVVQSGNVTFLECINPSAVNQGAVFISSGVLQCHRPQLQFFEYEATVPGDKFAITNNAFNAANVGTYTIAQVIDQNNIVINKSLTPIANISMNGLESAIFVEEGVAYYGYKRTLFITSQPGAPLFNLVTFDTNAQVDKIDQAAGVQMVPLNKLNFSTIIKFGLDSYSYNTGLIQAANRIVYGDPRDSVTYPGVGAAGADIFIREPLSFRVQVALSVRLNTGVPYLQTVTQVQSAVSSLINSNPVGQSIAISSIVSVVAAIPGILSVSVNSPQYSPAHDLIMLATGAKALIVDPTTDISVSQIGS